MTDYNIQFPVSRVHCLYSGDRSHNPPTIRNQGSAFLAKLHFSFSVSVSSNISKATTLCPWNSIFAVSGIVITASQSFLQEFFLAFL